MNGTCESDGARLGFHDTGAGVPVVFLHPTPLDHAYWRPVAEALTGVRAIIPDLRGHGVSELGQALPSGGFTLAPDAPVLTMAQLARDVLALLDVLEVPTAFFAGCSIGGYVLLELWRQAPQRMRGLVLGCTNPLPDPEANLAKRVESIAKVRQGGLAALYDGRAQTLIGETARRLRPEIVAQLRMRMTLTPEAEIAVQAGLATRPDSVATVSTITASVLAVAGGEDVGVTPVDMEAFLAAPGGCEYHVLADAGHFAAYEQPRKVADLLAAWLRKNPA